MMDNNQITTIKSYDDSAIEFMKKIGSLKNYNETYDFLINLINEDDNILDLACGPAQISKYIIDKVNVNVTGVDLSKEMLKIAKENIPNGVFIQDSITNVHNNLEYNLVIIGFGIPYLNKEQVKKCIKNCVSMLKINGHIYISFMDGNKQGFEETSFGGKNKFYLYYHQKEEIINIMKNNGIELIKNYELNYKEMDGRITKDIVLIGKKQKTCT
jgi:ubiquinone/menaquinone biosynthesis C-methylase UbiE